MCGCGNAKEKKAEKREVFEDAETICYSDYRGELFTFQAIHGYAGDVAKDKLMELWGYNTTYDQDIAAGNTLYIIEYEIKTLTDCTEHDLWNVLGAYRKAPSLSAGEIGTGYTVYWERSSDLYSGAMITVYEVGVVDGEYSEFYSSIILNSNLDDTIFVHHVIHNW